MLHADTADQNPPKEIKLSEYAAPGYVTTDTGLVFDIHEGETRVTSTLCVERRVDAADTLYLDGEDVSLVRVCVDGRELSSNEYAVSEEGLTIHGLTERHEIEIVTDIKPEENTALEGLYRSSSMYCTQCEAQGFRKITYYQDRPDVLSRFTTTVIADGERYPTLLSNGNPIASRELEGGRKSVTWQDPFPKPSYLFALVAGDLAMIEDTFTTMSGRQVTLQIFSEPHNIGQCDYAMDVLKRSMAWDEERFGREYDLDIFMIVAVEDFNMGAMENKGLNIFNTSCVLASPDTATDAAYERVEAVVAHEYFHNWSGNRVTCRDWFQLSLKEGFTVFRDAEFSSDMNSRPVKRIEDVKFLRAVQFAEDASPLAHPVRPQSYLEISNFYTTTIYEKGAEVVRMYQSLIGEEAFRRGTDAYFDRFDGAAATTDDFAAAMAEAGGVDLAQFKLWYEQAGTPRLDVTDSFAGGALTLSISQDCPATPNQPDKAPFHMPVEIGLLDASSGGELAVDTLAVDGAHVARHGNSLTVSLREADTTLKINGLEAKPVVSFLRNFSAPVNVTYARPDAELAFLARHDADGFVRWDALQSLWVKRFTEGETIEGVDLLDVVGTIAADACAQDIDPPTALLCAAMISVPEVDYLFEQLNGFQVMQVLDTRDAVVAELSHAHADTWLRLYERFAPTSAYAPDAAGMAARGLRNTALIYVATDAMPEQAGELILSHYHGADNLTDRRAALALACRLAVPQRVREEVLSDFYAKWHQEALVMDLWFNLQASAPTTTADGVKDLEQHELFSVKNPNRARSVIGAFGMLNHRNFHADDGSGYDYLKDAVLRLDALNPQLASRVCTPLTRWQRYEPARQALMTKRLGDMASATLSKDLFEIVNKSLAA